MGWHSAIGEVQIGFNSTEVMTSSNTQSPDSLIIRLVDSLFSDLVIYFLVIYFTYSQFLPLKRTESVENYQKGIPDFGIRDVPIRNGP